HRIAFAEAEQVFIDIASGHDRPSIGPQKSISLVQAETVTRRVCVNLDHLCARLRWLRRTKRHAPVAEPLQRRFLGEPMTTQHDNESKEESVHYMTSLSLEPFRIETRGTGEFSAPRHEVSSDDNLYIVRCYSSVSATSRATAASQ